MKNMMLNKGWIVIVICFLMFMSCPSISSNKSFFASINRDDLVVTSEVDKERYYPGEPVNITISVTNHGPDITLVFPTPQFANFKITKAYGRHIYRWGWHFLFPQVITDLAIKHGETKVLLRWTWYKLRDFYPFFPLIHFPVLPGEYYITGWMVGGDSHPKIKSEPAGFTLHWYNFN